MEDHMDGARGRSITGLDGGREQARRGRAVVCDPRMCHSYYRQRPFHYPLLI